MNNFFTSLDLELNQPSNKIIQIGACRFDLETGEVVDTFNRYVKIDEPLCRNESICDIPKLTGITDELLEEKGVDLISAYKDLAAWHRSPVPGQETGGRMNAVTWGGGDSREIFEELRDRFNYTDPQGYCFGRRWFDVKTLFQFFRMSQGETIQAGLGKACKRLGHNFEGRKHNALYDAINTAKIAHLLYEKMRGGFDNA